MVNDAPYRPLHMAQCSVHPIGTLRDFRERSGDRQFDAHARLRAKEGGAYLGPKMGEVATKNRAPDSQALHSKFPPPEFIS